MRRDRSKQNKSEATGLGVMRKWEHSGREKMLLQLIYRHILVREWTEDAAGVCQRWESGFTWSYRTSIQPHPWLETALVLRNIAKLAEGFLTTSKHKHAAPVECLKCNIEVKQTVMRVRGIYHCSSKVLAPFDRVHDPLTSVSQAPFKLKVHHVSANSCQHLTPDYKGER